QALRALVGAPFLDQPQARLELLLGGECFLGGDAQVAVLAAGLEFVGHPSCTAFSTMQAVTPSGPSSLPRPDHLTPRNGASARPIMWLWMPTMPHSSASARRRWRWTSPVQA